MADLTGKRVLVTGADGFIGSHLTEMLHGLGTEVRAFVLYNSFNSWGWLDGSPCADDIEIVAGDIRDGNCVRAALKDIDVVFHLAALIAIPYSYRAPASYIDTNVTGTLNVLEAARDAGTARVVQTSTSEVYGTAITVPIPETHPRQPQSPYSASKIAADALAESFHLSFGLPVVIARPFNTYGPRQSARAVIPTVITQIGSGQKQIRLGSLHPTRDFNYVADTCRGLISLAGCDAAIGRAVNIGRGEEISIGNLTRTIADLMGAEIEIVTEDDRIRPANSEVERLLCDSSLMHALTGYAPQTGLREGLEATIRWFGDARNLSRYKTGIYNV